MNLETAIEPPLWDAVRNSYGNRNFSGAILDAVYYLTDLLREKADLEGDGVELVGKALGGRNPRVKLNPLRSETDWNVQRGVEQLLRGTYQAIRNPRSHERVTDTEPDAIAIILFVNYLAKILGQSRSPFSKTAFLNRVFDPNFVKKPRYAELLTAEIPGKKRLEVFFDVFERKEQGDPEALKHFFTALFDVLDEEQLDEVYRAVSEEFRETDSDDAVRTVIRSFPEETWERIDEVARLRIENKLLRSINQGAYAVAQDRCRTGALGTWTSDVVKGFSMKKELATTVLRKLESKDFEEQEYAFRFFFPRMYSVLPWHQPSLDRVMVEGLKAGDIRFKRAVDGIAIWEEQEWSKSVQEALDAFVEVEPVKPGGPFEDDDLPF